jgi:predicted nucleic acid-binding protein
LDEKSYNLLSHSLKALPTIPINDEVIERAASWGYALMRKGKSISTTDIIIAACAHEKATLLHIDGDFEVISSITGLKEERLEL